MWLLDSKRTASKMHLDDLMSRLGNPGCYQIFIFFLLAFNYIPLVFNHIVMAFVGFTPPHVCVSQQLELAQRSNYSTTDVTADMLKMNSSIFSAKYGKCQTTYYGKYFGDYDNKTVFCGPDTKGSWEFDVRPGETTIATEWNLVCNEFSLSKLATTIYFCGVMLGGLVFGYLADRFGRKPVMLVCLYVPVAVGVGISFVQSYKMFVSLRFLQGFLMQGLQTSTYVLVMELFMPKYRSTAGALLECYWGVSVMMMAGLAYLLQSWRYLQLAISLPSILAVAYICLIPESLRWLITKNRMDEAEKMAVKYAQFNKLDFPLSTWETIKLQADVGSGTATQQYSNMDIVRTPRLRQRSFIMFYIWFAGAVGYYGLTFQITNLAGNKYLNFFIGGFVEFTAYCIAIYVVKRFGRRKPLCIYFVISSITCITAAFIPPIKTESGMDLTRISTGLAIAGKFGMGGVFSVMFLYASELFPTVVRNIGMGSCAFWARLGGVVAPQLVGLGEVTYYWLPLILFGVAALGGGILTLFLPETLGRKLPDTIQDAETMFDMATDEERKPFPIYNDVQLQDKSEISKV